jgi:hypothetical protein
MTLIKRLTLALCTLALLTAGSLPVQAADGGPTPAVSAPATNTADPAVAQAPQTNEQIRQWYNNQVAVIPDLNLQWQSEGLSAEERAQRAQDIRHAARIKARDFMQNQQEVADLRARDQEKYGNPDGPTFDQLVQANRAKGLEGDAVYEQIIKSSSRTNKEYNDRFGIKPSGQAP